MFESISPRLRAQKQLSRAAAEQAGMREQMLQRIRGLVVLMKELLRDSRYASYTQLLRETRDSLIVEREAILQQEGNAATRDHRVLLLTGRIMQLEYILTTPERFFALAEQREAGEATPVVAARSSAR